MFTRKVPSTFEEQIGRIQLATNTKTFAELAMALEIRISAVSDAKRRGRIPKTWLQTLHRKYGTQPEWVLAGNTQQPSACEETTRVVYGMPAQGKDVAVFLRTIPAKLLTEELLRRIDLRNND